MPLAVDKSEVPGAFALEQRASPRRQIVKMPGA
jgi:hypothetical protein